MNATSKGIANLLCNPDGATMKRIAWAFGCARKDSDEEAALYKILRERFETIISERAK